jgi:hypothetical protein
MCQLLLAFATSLLISIAMADSCINFSQSKICSGFDFYANFTSTEDLDSLFTVNLESFAADKSPDNCLDATDVGKIPYGVDIICSTYAMGLVSTAIDNPENTELDCIRKNTDPSKYVLCKSSCQAFVDAAQKQCSKDTVEAFPADFCDSFDEDNCQKGVQLKAVLKSGATTLQVSGIFAYVVAAIVLILQ